MEEEKEVAKEQQEPKERNILRDILEFVVYVAVVAGLAFFLYHFVGQQVEVDGHSMLNTLNNGEHLILEKITYRFGDPDRFDIVVFRPYEDDQDTYYIKRIIGLPGETVQIVDSKIYIDGQVVEEEYGREAMADPGRAADPVILGEGEYFVLGDNRNNSIDSRDGHVMAVKRKAIVGRAWLRIWPLQKFGILNHQ